MNMTTSPNSDLPAQPDNGLAAPAGDAPALDNVITSTAPSGAGHIRSFVHRRAHITPGQKEALDRLMPLWSLPYRRSTLDFAKAFGRAAPTVLEIGFGMGETTLKIAESRP